MASDRATVREGIERVLATALLSLPGSLQRLLCGGRPTTIDGQELEPDVQLMLALMRLSGQVSFETLPPAEARAELARAARLTQWRPIPMEEVVDRRIPGPAGEIPVRLYRPLGAEPPTPLIVYYHGGGWVVCDLDTHDGVCRFLAEETGSAVLSIDYRLAPEHPFPAAVDDALAAFRWAAAHGAELGIEPERIAVAGDSAGGNLSAVVSLLAVEQGGPRPAFQLLFYPVTDLSSKHGSYRLFSDGFFLTERQMDWYRDNYLPEPGAASDPRVSPLLADDLAGLPPAHVVTAGFDPLRDEGEAYARRLEQAGVKVSLRHPGLVHGFTNATELSRSARSAVQEAAALLARALGSGE
ncbi:MAG: alpha/beta hydrolase [Myxococcota bacterium]